MHPHAQLLTRFYESFARKDAEGMAACYHPEAAFSDPAFGLLDRDHACSMWRMLLGRSRDLAVRFEVLGADEGQGEARWEADYTFTKTGRPVHNLIQARFAFRDGLIFAHRDGFDFHAWAAQALGWKGRLFGGMDWFQRAFQKEARRTLQRFMDANP
ncbi:MAG: nuclear transport factor 2 family protein [Acidobacteria bacterium]|nr:nuclear transport factor 2 family protein [Acidobacteriota bacterium]